MQIGIVGKKDLGNLKGSYLVFVRGKKRIEEDVISFVMNMNVKP